MYLLKLAFFLSSAEGLVFFGGGAVSSMTFIPPSSAGPSLFKSLTALWANSVLSYSTKAQTLSVISGCLLAKGLTSAGMGLPGRKIRTRTISPQALKSSATASIVGLSMGRFNATTVLEGVVSSYSGRSSKRLT